MRDFCIGSRGKKRIVFSLLLTNRDWVLKVTKKQQKGLERTEEGLKIVRNKGRMLFFFPLKLTICCILSWVPSIFQNIEAHVSAFVNIRVINFRLKLDLIFDKESK